MSPLTQTPVKLSLASHLQDRLNRRTGLDRRTARVASAAGVFPYLKKSHREDFFEGAYAQMEKVGHHWTSHSEHGELLRAFSEFGGLTYCPPGARAKILKFLVLLYVGEPGGRTRYGNVRPVFYSNAGAPLAAEIIRSARELVTEDVRLLRAEREMRHLLGNQHVARRFESLLDLLESGEEKEGAAGVRRSIRSKAPG